MGMHRATLTLLKDSRTPDSAPGGHQGARPCCLCASLFHLVSCTASHPPAPGLSSFLVSTQPTAKTPWSGVSKALQHHDSRAKLKVKEQPCMKHIHSAMAASHT